MKKLRITTAGGVLLGLALGSIAPIAGCGGDSNKTGTQVPVDLKKEEEQRKEIKKYY
jgi:hypothetical protein